MKNKDRWVRPIHEISIRYQKCKSDNCGNSVRNPNFLRDNIRSIWSPYCQYCQQEIRYADKNKEVTS